MKYPLDQIAQHVKHENDFNEIPAFSSRQPADRYGQAESFGF